MKPIKSPPTTLEIIIFQLPIPVAIKITAPINIASVEVSPIEPGITPKNISASEGNLSM